MNEINEILSSISGFLWGVPMIVLLVGTHIFLTIRLKFPQRHMWKAIKLSVKKDSSTEGDVSQFGALSTSLAATIGTGNIIGVATAISLGGPGAVFWCFITGIFGIATKYGEGVLAVKYRSRTNYGKIIGGPMYALEKGLHQKWLAVLFCIFTAFAAFGIGDAVQANAISENLTTMMHVDTNAYGMRVIIGLIFATLTALVIFGGVTSISRICSMFVPVMAAIYIIGCIVILIINKDVLWQSICWICSDAFSLKAGVGGAAGTAIMMTMRYGIARGLFSNESGLGSAPIVAAAAQTRNSVRQGLVLASGAFWDTVVICTLTGLVVVSSIMLNKDIDLGSSGVLTTLAFSKIPYIGAPLLTFGIITFAFSTILGWCYYGEKAIEYLFGSKMITAYRWVWVLLIIVGSVVPLDLVWNFADSMNAMMAIPNLIALLGLSGIIVAETKKYLWSNNLEEEDKEI